MTTPQIHRFILVQTPKYIQNIKTAELLQSKAPKVLTKLSLFIKIIIIFKIKYHEETRKNIELICYSRRAMPDL